MQPVQHSRPTIGEAEGRAVSEVIASGHHARGPKCRAYEERLAASVGRRWAHATTSGTSALQLALIALGADANRSVLIPSLACAALLNAVWSTGADPVFYDSSYGLPDPDTLQKLADENTCALILVAPPTGMRSLAAFGKDGEQSASLDGIPIIYDRCQQLSNAAASPTPALEVFSSYATKCISTGTGGAIVGDDSAIQAEILDFNDHDNRESYEHERYNFQFDDLRAAMGIVQVARLPAFEERRRKIAEAYDQAFGQSIAEESGICFRYLLDCGNEAGMDRVQWALGKAMIEAKRPVFRPLHRYMDMKDEDFPQTTDAWQRHISLPIYPLLSDLERDTVITYTEASMP